MGETTEIAEQTAEIGLSTSLLWIGVIGMLLLAFSVIFFFVVYQKRLFAQKARMQQRELDYQRNLVNAAIETQEAERRRIASDLHDEIGSLLSATRLYLRQLKPEGEPAKNEQLKQEAIQIVTETITNTRRITHNLLPPSLEQFGLGAAAEDLCQKISDAGAIKVDCISNQKERFEMQSEVALFRILQELLNNTLKHAGAENVLVKLHFTTNGLSFSYQDDGKGFMLPDKEDVARRNFGLGFKSIESRVNFVGGKMKVDTKPNQGLKLTIKVDQLRIVD